MHQWKNMTWSTFSKLLKVLSAKVLSANCWNSYYVILCTKCVDSCKLLKVLSANCWKWIMISCVVRHTILWMLQSKLPLARLIVSKSNVISIGEALGFHVHAGLVLHTALSPCQLPLSNFKSGARWKFLVRGGSLIFLLLKQKQFNVLHSWCVVHEKAVLKWKQFCLDAKAV